MHRWSAKVKFFSLVFVGAFAFGACGDDLVEGTTGESDSDSTETSSETSAMTTAGTTAGTTGATEGSTGGSTTIGTTFGPDTDPLTTTPTTGSPTSVGPATDSITDTEGTDTEGVTSDGTDTEGGTDTDGGGACCEPHGGLGCDDADIEACVCEQDGFCCETEWDDLCVEEVDTFGCGSCGIMPDSCCEPHMEPGCGDVEVALCVCEALPQCCEEGWGPECVEAVDMMQCGMCEMDAGDCCVENGSPACNQPDVAGCVCETMPECCEDVWSQACADSVELLGCGLCEQQLGPCCEAGNGPGCEDPDVAACVCDVAPGCCESEWNEVCADLVGFLGCGSCSEGECCEANDTPGCGDPEIESCVCDAAPSCCQDPWSDACAVLVEQLGCGMCGGMMFEGDCCVGNGTPGCEDPEITECVCSLDPFCCENEWDDICAAGAIEQCGAQCP